MIPFSGTFFSEVSTLFALFVRLVGTAKMEQGWNDTYSSKPM